MVNSMEDDTSGRRPWEPWAARRPDRRAL